MPLIAPSSEEANSATATAVNSEKLRRELEPVFGGNAETVADLDEGALVTVMMDALRHAS